MTNPNLSIQFVSEQEALAATLNRYLNKVTLMLGVPWKRRPSAGELWGINVHATFSLVALGSGDTNAGSLLLTALLQAQDTPMTGRVTFFGESGDFEISGFNILHVQGEVSTSNVTFGISFNLGRAVW